jgi:Tfp pilus assembly protein FimT
MRNKALTKGFSTAAAGISMTIASLCLAAFAVPHESPAQRARQLDSSAQEIANFLQKARSQAVWRNAPVACRIEMDGSHTVLWLDWSLNGPKTGAHAERLVLDRGMVLMQAGILQRAGTLAVFNPRGGVMSGAVRLGFGEPVVLSLWQRGGPTTGVRDIAMTGSGDFEVAGISPTP